jgi:RNA12 protein
VFEGFSETLDTQLSNVWNITATALKGVALDGRKKGDKDFHLGPDDYLEAHPEKRPVIVIDNFLHKNSDGTLVYDKISEWAAGLVSANIAHVIFLTTDVSFSKSLSKALPDRVFRIVSLGDCTPQVAKRFVVTHLEGDPEEVEKGDAKSLPVSQKRTDLNELDECIYMLGGRLTDLEFLARRMKTGETPKRAVHEIIQQSASEILKMYLLDVESSGDRKWTPQQAWLLISQLAQKDDLRYNEVLLHDTYKSGGEIVLAALEQAELISIVSSNGRPTSIKPGKPVYSQAFKTLVKDPVLQARLDLALYTELIKIETQSIDKYESELSLLASLPKQPGEIGPRVKYLLTKLRGAQERVEAYEGLMGGFKGVLKKDY